MLCSGYFNFNKTDPAFTQPHPALTLGRISDAAFVASHILKLVDGANPFNAKLMATGLKTIGSSRKCGQLFYVDDKDKTLCVLGESMESERSLRRKKIWAIGQVFICSRPRRARPFTGHLQHKPVFNVFNDRDETLYANAS